MPAAQPVCKTPVLRECTHIGLYYKSNGGCKTHPRTGSIHARNAVYSGLRPVKNVRCGGSPAATGTERPVRSDLVTAVAEHAVRRLFSAVRAVDALCRHFVAALTTRFTARLRPLGGVCTGRLTRVGLRSTLGLRTRIFCSFPVDGDVYVYILCSVPCKLGQVFIYALFDQLVDPIGERVVDGGGLWVRRVRLTLRALQVYAESFAHDLALGGVELLQAPYEIVVSAKRDLTHYTLISRGSI